MIRMFFKLDWVLVCVSALLFLVGLLARYSLSAAGGTNYFLKQSLFAILAFGTMFFVGSLDYRYIQKYSTALYFATIATLFLVLLFGTTVNGTDRG